MKQQKESGFITMIVIMLAIIAGATILVFLRVKSAQG